MNPLARLDAFFEQFMPPMTRRLFYVLVVVFVGQMVLDAATRGLFTGLLALRPTLVARGFVWQLGTHGFLHGGFGHLFSNALALFFFGAPVEMRLGGRRYLGMLLAAVLAGGVVMTVLNWGDPKFLAVGFSGAVYAILMGCLLFIPNQVVYLNFLFPMKMKWLVVAYLVFDLYAAVRGLNTGIGHWAHLTGAAVGFAWIKGEAFRGGGGGGGRGGGRRVRSKPLSMGHPGRSARASKLYDDPHWRLDQ